ncbi:caspase-8-like [Scomber scombrus]|uniref:Caspase-8-like n=1 Tax=Scomber scombrus TaxID=13677 RepID=A0AAV1Q148_SCOSC
MSHSSHFPHQEPYKLECKPVGLCVIINNKNFMKKKPREGTDKDAESLAEVFSWLGFRILMCEDQESEKMKATLQYFASPGDLSQLQEFSAKEWSGSEFIDPQKAPEHGDAFICCVLSHGELGEVSGIDDKHLSIKEITRTFRETEDSPLTGKPKVFLIQACQGSMTPPGVKSAEQNLQCDSSKPETTADLVNVLVAIATVEDYKAGRDPYHGSWFIQSVCQKLKEGCLKGENISEIFTSVTDEVSKKDGRTKEGPFKQVPEIRSTLTKSLVLSPHHK